ncbi:MAG: class E sortase [Acidimicrobiia bacterium]|nr:class E sortase [Acidimicrobiia bacterium]
MRKGLSVGAAALVLALGAACGARSPALPRYVSYAGQEQAQAQAAPDSATGDTLPADAADDPTPADYVDAGPAVVGPRPAAAVAAPINLDFGARGAIGRVEIPKVGLSQPMFEGVGLDVLANGPGHWTGTAMPGDNGNVVVAGHRVTHTHPFLDIDQLQPGDQVIFTTAAGRFIYAVSQTFIVTPDATWIANPTTDPTFTLFACHPKHEKTHRIVVTGHLVNAERTGPAPAAPAPAAVPPPAAPVPPPAPAPTPPPATTPAAAPSASPPPDPSPRCDAWICPFGR